MDKNGNTNVGGNSAGVGNGGFDTDGGDLATGDGVFRTSNGGFGMGDVGSGMENVGSGTGNVGFGAENVPVSTSGNGAESHGEAQEGGSGRGDGYESLSGQAAQDGAGNGFRMQNTDNGNGNFGQNMGGVAGKGENLGQMSQNLNEKAGQRMVDMAGDNGVPGQKMPNSGDASKVKMKKTQQGQISGPGVKTKRGGVPVWAVVLLVVVVLGAGIGVFYAIQNSKKENAEGSVDKPTTTEPVDKTETPEAPKVEELALDDELVQRLYNQFGVVGSAYTSTLDFYGDADVRQGKVNREMMLNIALGGSWDKAPDCKMEHYLEVGEESYEVGELFGCQSGEMARKRIQEIFNTEIELEDGEMTGDYCGAWKYDAASDEFYVPSLGCGGSCLYNIGRELEKAERDEQNVYLYETAYGQTCQELYHTNGDLIAEAELDENGMLVKGIELEDYRDQLDRFKWTFTKNDDGEYIFTGLTKVE